MKMLVIGRRDGNIADVLVKSLDEDWDVYAPDGPEELDVTDAIMIGQYISDNGPFDAVLYAAATNRLRWIEHITMHSLHEVYAVNVFGFVQTVRYHLREFRDYPTRFVAVVSDASRTPMRGSLMYGSSKAALSAVIKNMARELAPKQTVVGVSPTVVADTPMTDYIDQVVPAFRGWSPEQAAAYEASNIPLGRRLTKAEVADALLFALEGPDGLTGSIIEITGGK